MPLSGPSIGLKRGVLLSYQTTIYALFPMTTLFDMLWTLKPEFFMAMHGAAKGPRMIKLPIKFGAKGPQLTLKRGYLLALPLCHGRPPRNPSRVLSAWQGPVFSV